MTEMVLEITTGRNSENLQIFGNLNNAYLNNPWTKKEIIKEILKHEFKINKTQLDQWLGELITLKLY